MHYNGDRFIGRDSLMEIMFLIRENPILIRKKDSRATRLGMSLDWEIQIVYELEE